MSARAANCLRVAEALINGDRREAYGEVKESFARLASIWSAILNRSVTPQQVALCMIALKLCREAHAHSFDNLVDICGYAGLLEKLESVSEDANLPAATPVEPKNEEGEDDVPF